MTIRRPQPLIWLLVSLFALRGLIPAGYMLDISGGSPSIAVCAGDGPMNMAALNQSEHAGHEHHHQHGGGHEGHEKHSSSICPFALVGSAALTPTIAAPLVSIAAIHNVDIVKVVAFHGLFGPSRAQQSRAPPYFA